jgi:hypothetical protein
MLPLVHYIISSQCIIVCYYSWQYCINKVRDYPNTGLVAATAHDYVKNRFHAQYMRRVRYSFRDTLYFTSVLRLYRRFLTSIDRVTKQFTACLCIKLRCGVEDKKYIMNFGKQPLGKA